MEELIYIYIYIYYLLILVSAFTLVGLNRLPSEQVQHHKPSQPTFADPEPGYTKWRANRDSIAEDQLLGDLIVVISLFMLLIEEDILGFD